MPISSNRRHPIPSHPLRRLSLLAGLLLLLAGLSACGLLREQVPTSAPPPVLHVSPDQLAASMQADHFFSDYNPYSLLVQGVIASVDHPAGGLTIALKTSLALGVECDLGSSTARLNVGDPITVSAPGAQAQRTDSAVVLKNCTLP